MAYRLFLVDLDDTLLDFTASQRLSFFAALSQLGFRATEEIYSQYQAINESLWQQFERGEVTKEHLKTERFRKLFADNGITLNAEQASTCYLDTLPQTVVLTDGATELCEWLSTQGEIGIITNGIHDVQTQRIANSAIAPFISFVCVSDSCGYAKPDLRFFEHSAGMAKSFDKATTLVIGDRLEADILGAERFGVDACWFNPHKKPRPAHPSARYEISHLSQLHDILAQTNAPHSITGKA